MIKEPHTLNVIIIILQWLETEFLPYLEQWERTVAEREGYTDAEKKNMLLSVETSTGLKLTGIATAYNVISLYQSHLDVVFVHSEVLHRPC